LPRSRYSFSDNGITAGNWPIGRREALTEIRQPPEVRQAGTGEEQRAMRTKVGIGFGLLYENQDNLDFSTIDANGSVGFTSPTDTARIDYLGGLITGYGARPYRGFSTFIRLLFQF
jgi:hypothetical protein